MDIPISLNIILVPYIESAKYFGTNLDAKLKWEDKKSGLLNTKTGFISLNLSPTLVVR